MCGRYTITIAPEEIEARFHISVNREKYKINYNAAPSQELPVITNASPGKLDFLRWGLIPYWTREIKPHSLMINSRAETIREKPSFRSIFSKKRCLIISDGFYEWSKSGKIKQPFRIIFKNNELFAFAGLWDTWINNEITVNSFSIITTEANLLVKTIHDRMPAIIRKNDEEKWLNTVTGPDELSGMLRPYDHQEMKMYPVRTLVNSIQNNSSELIVESDNNLSLQ